MLGSVGGDILRPKPELPKTFEIVTDAARRIPATRQGLPSFSAHMAKEQLPVQPITGEQAAKIVDEQIGALPNIIAPAKSIYE
jgi:hypothetical protein